MLQLRPSRLVAPLTIAVGLAALTPAADAQELTAVPRADFAGAPGFPHLGFATAMEGDIALVGQSDYSLNPGSVRVYVRGAAGWALETELGASDAFAGQDFGWSVDLERRGGDGTYVAAVGAPGRNGSRGAVYVFERDTAGVWTEVGLLTRATGAQLVGFGESVGVSGDTVVSAAYFDDFPNGKVHVFQRAGTSWTESVLPSPGARQLGQSVAIDGDTILARSEVSVQVRGAVYVFDRQGTSWVASQVLPKESQLDTYQGQLAIEGDRCIVPNGSNWQGATQLLVFERGGSSWSLAETLRPEVWGSRFGRSVAMDGDVVVSGNVENAFVFQKQGTSWDLRGHLRSPRSPYDASGDAKDFGFAVAVAGGNMLVGSPDEDWGRVDFLELQPFASLAEEAALVSTAVPLAGLGSALSAAAGRALLGASDDDSGRGAAFVHVRAGSVWTEEQRLAASDSAPGSSFGNSVDLDRADGATAAVGAPGDGELGADAGAAYVFTRAGTVWTEAQKLLAPDGAAGDTFGDAVAVDGDRLVVGASNESNLNGLRAGSVYVFERSGSTWAFVHKLRSDEGGNDQRFGLRLELEGSRLVVGAPLERVAIQREGAVYVLEGPSWTQTARILDPDPHFSHVNREFGHALSLQGGELAVGTAGGEEVYVFAHDGTAWTPGAPVWSPDGYPGDGFGDSVALDGGRLVVGASGDDDGTAGSGRAFVFLRDGDGWRATHKLVPTAPAEDAALGTHVAVDGDRAIASLPGAGGALAFVLPDAYAAFCDASDGALAACPCANPGLPDTGCDIAQGTGGLRLDVVAQETGPQNRATLAGAGYPPASAPGVTVLRSTALDPASPVVFGDGLRCIGVPVVRVGATLGAGGTSVQTVGHGAGAGAGTFYYQLWVRNTPAMYCTPDAFNLTNGRAITW